jgi:hypothetical protein
MSVRLRTLLLILLLGFGSFQMAEARDPRVKPVKPGKYAYGKRKPSQPYRTAKAPKKVKYKKFKSKQPKQQKFKQAKFKQAKFKKPKNPRSSHAKTT